MLEWEDLMAGRVEADVLANSSAVGMAPKVRLPLG